MNRNRKRKGVVATLLSAFLSAVVLASGALMIWHAVQLHEPGAEAQLILEAALPADIGSLTGIF